MPNDERLILIVDDQENWRDALTSVLKGDGYAVDTASNFLQAQKHIQARKYDLVVLDVRLVDLDIFNIQGLELLQIIKKKNAYTRVIILTGYPKSIKSGVLDRFGADALVLKAPLGARFDTVEFCQTIKSLINS